MKKYIIFLAVMVLSGIVSSCAKLDVQPPFITDEQINEILKGNDEAKINLVLKAIANNLQNNFNISQLAHPYTKYSAFPENSQTHQDFARNAMGNDVVLGSATSSNSYYQMNQTYFSQENDWPFFAICSIDIIPNANKALKYLTADKAQASATIKEYRGRALTVRSYGYMLLMERFQKAYTNGGKDGKGMPIYENYGINNNAEISSAKDTYEFLIKDMKEAVKNLEETVGYTTDIKNDIDASVAQYILARIALWYGDWETCISACKSVIAKYPEFIKEKNYGVSVTNIPGILAGTSEAKAEDNAFHSIAANPETILGFANGEAANYQLFYGFTNIFVNNMVGNDGLSCGTGGYGQQWPCIDSRLYKMIDANDFRHELFLTDNIDYEYIIDKNGTKESHRINKYANTKFAATTCAGTAKRDVNGYGDNIIIRSSEVTLMLAEAYAQSGKDAMAKDVLNKLLAARTKTGKPALTCDTYAGMAGKTALHMVQLQERIEMWCEKGLEYYNNKRWNIPVDRTGSENHYSVNTKMPVENMTLEIPRQEQQTNTNWLK